MNQKFKKGQKVRFDFDLASKLYTQVRNRPSGGLYRLKGHSGIVERFQNDIVTVNFDNGENYGCFEFELKPMTQVFHPRLIPKTKHNDKPEL